MQTEIILQRRCGGIAYYVYSKSLEDRSGQKYVICVPHFGLNAPDTLRVEVSESTIEIKTKDEDDATHLPYTFKNWDSPQACADDLPQLRESIGLKKRNTDGQEKITLRTINIESVDYLLSMSDPMDKQVLSTVPIRMRPYPSEMPTIQSGKFYLQNVCEKGEVVALIMRDYHNQYSGWIVFSEYLEYFNGTKETSILVYYAGGHLIGSRDAGNRYDFYLHMFENITWEYLDGDSKNLVNSWIESEVREDIVEQDTLNTCKREVLKRNKELGLIPVSEHANGLFENVFDSNPNLMTDDEYEMIFGVPR